VICRLKNGLTSWTMVIERLPNFDKDGRFDTGAKRVNCGTRPVTPDFIEEISSGICPPREVKSFPRVDQTGWKDFRALARGALPRTAPGRGDHCRGGQANAGPPALLRLRSESPDPSKQFRQMLDQMRQLAELRSVLFPDQPARPGRKSRAADRGGRPAQIARR
jgi:hypothetical protein